MLIHVRAGTNLIKRLVRDTDQDLRHRFWHKIWQMETDLKLHCSFICAQMYMDLNGRSIDNGFFDDVYEKTEIQKVLCPCVRRRGRSGGSYSNLIFFWPQQNVSFLDLPKLKNTNGYEVLCSIIFLSVLHIITKTREFLHDDTISMR